MSLIRHLDVWLFGPDAIYFWSLYALCIAALLMVLRWVAGAELVRDLWRNLRDAFLDSLSREIWDYFTIFGLLRPRRWAGSMSMVRGYVPTMRPWRTSVKDDSRGSPGIGGNRDSVPSPWLVHPGTATAGAQARWHAP